MTHLLTVLNSSDPRSVLEINLERLDRSLAFSCAPACVNGAPTDALGPPALGAFVPGDLWCDALGALWRCAQAGEPGLWHQLHPAVLSAFPDLIPPEGYLARRSDLQGALYVYESAAAQWTLVPAGYPPGGNTRLDAQGNLWIKGSGGLFRRLMVLEADGVPVLALSDDTQL